MYNVNSQSDVDLTIFYVTVIVKSAEFYERVSFLKLQFRVFKIKPTITECKKSTQKIIDLL